MNASTLLQQIQDAKRYHLRWVKRVEELVNGKMNDKGSIELSSEKCDFGKWFYSTGQKLRVISSIGNIMNRIEIHHDDLHDTYYNIYNLYFVTPTTRPFMKKVITFNSQKISHLEKEIGKVHLKYLQRSSKEMIELLTILESKVSGLEYTEIAKL